MPSMFAVQARSFSKNPIRKQIRKVSRIDFSFSNFDAIIPCSDAIKPY